MNINCRSTILDFESPKVMAILNLTPDSFYDGKAGTNEEETRLRIDKLVRQNPAIIDVGGMSSRPGATILSSEDEWERIEFALKYLRSEFPNQIISIDTINEPVARRSLELGAHIINDISGGNYDSKMLTTVAEFEAVYILMHMRSSPKDMQNHTDYPNGIVMELMTYFKERLEATNHAGIKDVILDLGFGFSKTLDQNYKLLNMMHTFKIFGQVLLAGLSRKSMIYKTLDTNAEQALNGTTALHMKALLEGANILRVHDVVEANEVIELYKALQRHC